MTMTLLSLISDRFSVRNPKGSVPIQVNTLVYSDNEVEILQALLKTLLE